MSVSVNLCICASVHANASRLYMSVLRFWVVAGFCGCTSIRIYFRGESFIFSFGRPPNIFVMHFMVDSLSFKGGFGLPLTKWPCVSL